MIFKGSCSTWGLALSLGLLVAGSTCQGSLLSPDAGEALVAAARSSASLCSHPHCKDTIILGFANMSRAEPLGQRTMARAWAAQARGGGRGKLTDMFDAEVIAMLREQFNEADADGSGEIDSQEAAVLFAKYCAPGSSEAEIRATASSLANQMDSDRSGTISFEEYAFRFGRKLQMEVARRRREGNSAPGGREVGPGMHLHERRVNNTEDSKSQNSAPATSGRGGGGGGGGWGSSSATSGQGTVLGVSRETAIVFAIGAAMLVFLVVAVVLPAPDDGRQASTGRTRGR